MDKLIVKNIFIDRVEKIFEKTFNEKISKIISILESKKCRIKEL